MIQGIRRLASVDTEHNLLHETLARNSLGLIPQIATASGEIGRDTIPNNYMQFYQVHSETRLYINVNNSVFSFKVEDLPRNTYEKVAITGGDTSAGFLDDKVDLGYGLSSVVNNSGANETLSITSTLTGKKSIQSDTGNLQLVGDTASPGNDKVYGTDSSGDRGWKSSPVVPNVLSGCKVYLSSHQASDGSLVKIGWNTEIYDIGSDYNTSTKRFVVPTTGIYMVTAHIYLTDFGAGGTQTYFIYKGGSAIQTDTYSLATAGDSQHTITGIFSFAAGNYIEIYVDPSEACSIRGGSTTVSYMAIHRLS